jgi:HEPN domain-containing protein
MTDSLHIYLTKAEESLRGAESEFTQGRYNNAANRCYYASFQAAVAALHHVSVAPRGGRTSSPLSGSRCASMRAEQLDLSTHRMQAAIEELRRLIQRHYPEATFQVEPGDDPTGMYVLATVDVEDTDVVVEVYIDRLLELQIDEGLAVYVVPVRPLARVQIS